MKKSGGFWSSLEIYTWKVVERSPLPLLRESEFAQTAYSAVLRLGRFGGQAWVWVGVAIVSLVLLTSALNAQNSVVGATTLKNVIEAATKRGDYALANRLYQAKGGHVLGAEAELENMIYPEQVVERKIIELETKLADYPGNREIYLALSKLYSQLDNRVKADEYREKARILDPNN